MGFLPNVQVISIGFTRFYRNLTEMVLQLYGTGTIVRKIINLNPVKHWKLLAEVAFIPFFIKDSFIAILVPMAQSSPFRTSHSSPPSNTVGVSVPPWPLCCVNQKS